MMVPSTRLLWLMALALLPGAAVAAFVPSATGLAVAVAVAALVLAAIDAFRSKRRLDGFRVVLPDIVRLAKDRDASFEVRVIRDREMEAQRPRPAAPNEEGNLRTGPPGASPSCATLPEEKLRLGFALPPEIVPELEDSPIVLPAGAKAARLDWKCTPTQRGSYRLDRCYLELPSQMKLWSIRASTPVDCEIRVYPNLLSDRESAASLLLNSGHTGSHMQRQVGQGREFEKLREYSSGDSFDEIHWKATARRGHPITKVFQIEKTQEVYVVIDSSRLSARETGGDPILERFITAGLLLGVSAERQGDLFGLLSFSDRVDRFVPAKSGKSHHSVCRDALYTVKPRLVSPDFHELCTFIRLRLRRRALLMVLTELDDPVLAESFERSIRLISRQHLVLVCALKPPGLGPLFEGTQAESESDVYAGLANHMRWHKLQEVAQRLKQRGVHFSLLESKNLALQLTAQYKSVKQRQLL